MHIKKILRDWSLLMSGTRAEGNIKFSLKKVIPPQNFNLKFHTPSKNPHNISYPTVNFGNDMMNFMPIVEPKSRFHLEPVRNLIKEGCFGEDVIEKANEIM